MKYDYQKDNKPTLEIYGNGDSTFYHYDGFNRLDSIWAHNKFGQLIYSIGATIDANGRHTQENLQIVYQGAVDTTLPQLTNGTASYTYQLRNRITSGNGRTYLSDNAGNIDSATSPSMGLSWSVYGQLLGVNRGSNQTAYEYDGIGIRRRKDATYYVVDQQNTGNVLVESTQNGTGISTYIWGNGLVARINPQNDSEYYYHYDFRGSVVCITNQNGQVIQFYKYDPYGKIYAQKGNLSWNNPYRYMGRWGCQTDDSDLLYCKARYYQISIGRFLSEDISWNTNLFVYGDDDPINSVDPNGMYSVTGQVSIGESLIPVYGSWRQGMYNAKQGNYWTAAFYGVLAVTEVVGIGEAAKAAQSAYKFARLYNAVAPTVDFITEDYAKSSLTRGQIEHAAYHYGEYGKEFRLPSGSRVDFLDIDNGTINELKPRNPRQIKAGYDQLLRYQDELQGIDEFKNIKWNLNMDTYK